MQQYRTIIKPAAGVSFHFKELWQHRELLYFFAWRDIKVKYKQTALGILWALLQPLALMLLFTLVFSKTSIAQKNTGLPYTLFVLSGLIVWNLFYSSVSHAAESLLNNSSIIKKIYFPRLIIPASALIAALVDFAIAFGIFIIFCFLYHQSISPTAILFFPLAVLLCLLTAFGAGTLLGALNIKYRDVRYALPFLLQALFFATQIIYPASVVQSQLMKYVFALNPLNAAIELFQIPISHTAPDVGLILTGAATSAVLALLGFLYFKKTEAYIADII